MTTDDYPVRLPPLRQDIVLMLGPRNEKDGSPTWTIHDPPRQRFFRIGQQELHILNAWSAGTVAEITKRLCCEEKTTVSSATVQAMVDFLIQNSLVRRPRGHTLKLEKTGLVWLFHHYLFFKIHLLRPERFLERLLPVVGWFFLPWWRRTLLGSGILGWFMTVQHWDQFMGTIPGLLEPQVMVWLGLAIFLAKITHEFGHALTAKRFGVCVPSMGVAFLVLWPVLYSEMSEAWKLPSRRERLAITAAGIKAEIALAIVATFLWNLVPDGGFRTALFLVATSTWMTTLTINLSPFMRFDGYYLLSDWLDLPNLHTRAFAVGQWWLRKLFLGANTACPESWQPRQRRFLIGFALTTWIYRLVLFLSIALLVYHFFFKFLGLVLMAAEVGWFVLRPLVRELIAWGRVIPHLHSWKRLFTSMGLLLLLLVLSIVPWKTDVVVAALLKSEEIYRLHAPVSSKIHQLQVTVGQNVQKDQLLLVLESPTLNYERDLSQKRLEILENRLAQGMTDPTDLAERDGLAKKVAQETARFRGLQAQWQQLSLKAPFAGRVVDLADALRVGRWFNSMPSLVVIRSEKLVVSGFVRENDLERIHMPTRGLFIPDSPEYPSLPVALLSVDWVATSTLDLPELATVFGGPIPARLEKSNVLKSEVAIFRVRMELLENFSFQGHPLRGVVRLQGDAQSLVARMGRWIMAVVLRETSF